MEPQEHRNEPKVNQGATAAPPPPPTPGYGQSAPPTQGFSPQMSSQIPQGYQSYGPSAYENRPQSGPPAGFWKRLYGDDGTAVSKMLKVISYIFFCLVPLSFIGGIITFILTIAGGAQYDSFSYFAYNTLPAFVAIFSAPLKYFVFGVLTIGAIKVLAFLKPKE